MVGEVRHRRAYYLCRPSNNNRGRPDNYLGHPKTLYLREDELLDAVAGFLADRVFGPDRRAILDAQLAGLDTGEANEREAQRAQLQKAIDGLVKKQESVLEQAMEGDPDDAFTNDLEAHRANLAAKLAAIDESVRAEVGEPSDQALSILDALPYLAVNLAKAPEDLLRILFEVVQLSVQVQRGRGHSREDWRPDEPARDARGACWWGSGSCPRRDSRSNLTGSEAS